jgi:hypothetical protein
MHFRHKSKEGLWGNKDMWRVLFLPNLKTTMVARTRKQNRTTNLKVLHSTLEITESVNGGLMHDV